MRDVILIGECRTAYAAKMAVRAALTGHTVFTTLHAGSGKEAINRLLDLGVNENDLKEVLRALFAQRLFPSPDGRECVYEIWNRQDLEDLFDNHPPDISLKKEVAYALEQGWILPDHRVAL